VNTTANPDRFISLPDEHAPAATVAALEEPGGLNRSLLHLPFDRLYGR
jgi:hypothetical protein